MKKELEIVGKDYGGQAEEVKYPLYINNYLDIIKIFLKINEKRGRYEEGLGNREDELGHYHMDPHDMGNVITIVGRRGSGKTTVIQEMRSILKNFNLCKKDWFQEIGEPYASELKGQIDKEYYVDAMEIIDASVLEEKDDLLEIILWYMYEQVSKKIDLAKSAGFTNANNWELGNFTKSVDEVYRMHQSIKGKRQEERGESVVTLLDNMPNSIRTRRAMGKLIEAYLKIMYPGKENSAYLLIPIDDLDLNIRKGYQMLEEIRRYLLDWRIIVLLAVDYEQMEKVCENRFRKEFENGQGIYEEELNKHIRNLSDSYMIKVFPISHRIYLTEKSLKSSYIKEMNNDKVEMYQIKEYLLTKISEKMGIYYDAYGLKTHFCV
ncbi:MAG: P-loop NTPase fold protein, partial [Bacillota bacterium]|nr:P-loop NTPase fold protein [Bacillota bacterium]